MRTAEPHHTHRGEGNNQPEITSSVISDLFVRDNLSSIMGNKQSCISVPLGQGHEEQSRIARVFTEEFGGSALENAEKEGFGDEM